MVTTPHPIPSVFHVPRMLTSPHPTPQYASSKNAKTRHGFPPANKNQEPSAQSVRAINEGSSCDFLSMKHAVVSSPAAAFTIFFSKMTSTPSHPPPSHNNHQNKTKQNKTKQNKTKQNKTKQNKTKQNKTPQIHHSRSRHAALSTSELHSTCGGSCHQEADTIGDVRVVGDDIPYQTYQSLPPCPGWRSYTCFQLYLFLVWLVLPFQILGLRIHPPLTCFQQNNPEHGE